MVDVSVPTINTLHGMPSLSHLSSTQSKLENCNVHYSGFDTDLSTSASVDDQINTNDPVANASVDPPVATLFPPPLPCPSQGKYCIRNASNKGAGNDNHLHIALIFYSLP
jgi:hypothetical protein